MSEDRDDGGPAFPHVERDQASVMGIHAQYPGLSLRDWFAGQALVGMGDPTSWGQKVTATWAYEIADAMLAERKKK